MTSADAVSALANPRFPRVGPLGVVAVALAVSALYLLVRVGPTALAQATVNGLVTGSSHISVTLLGNAGQTVAYVARDPGNGFTVFLTGAATASVDFSYSIVDPA